MKNPFGRLVDALRSWLAFPPSLEPAPDGPEDPLTHWQLFDNGEEPGASGGEGISMPPPTEQAAEPPLPVGDSVDRPPPGMDTPPNAASPQNDADAVPRKPPWTQRLRAFLTTPAPAPDGQEPGKPRWQRWLHSPRAWSIAAASLVLLIVIVAVIGSSDPPELPATELVVVNDMAATTGKITFAVPDGVDAAYLNEHLTISPQTKFYAREQDNGNVQVALQTYANEMYTLTIVLPDGEIQVLKLNEDPLSVIMTSSSNNVQPNGTIVLQFSHPVSEQQVERHVRIGGYAFDFSIDDTGKTVSLRTHQPLSYDTTYTVSVNGNFMAANGKRLIDDARMSFQIVRNPYELALLNPEAQLIPEGETLILEFEAFNRLLSEMPVVINLYRFPSLEKYGEQAQALMDYPMIDLTMVAQVETFLELLPNGGSEVSIPFPGEGGYILEIIADHPSPNSWDVEQITFRKAVSVTDLSLYMQTGRAQTLAWLNHAESGQALGGYRIEFAHAVRGEAETTMETNAAGVATLLHQAAHDDTPEVVRVYDDNDVLVYIDHTQIINNQYETSFNDLYYSYFYLDRPLYRPTDEINFWGFVRPYGANRGAAPTELEVVFDSGGLDIQVTVPVDGTGSFVGTLDIEQIKSAQYRVITRIPAVEEDEDDEAALSPAYDYYYDYDYYYSYGEDVLDSVWIDVKEYETPDMQIKVETDRDWYGPDDEVVVTVTPSFYDGTALPFFDLEFYILSDFYGGKSDVINLTTGENGTAEVRFPAHQRGDGPGGWGPIENRFEVRISTSGENVIAYGSYIYFPTDIILSGGIDTDEDDLPVVNLWTSELVTNAVTARLLDSTVSYRSGSYYREDIHAPLRGGPVDGEIIVEGRIHYYPIGHPSNGNRVEIPFTETLTTTNGTVSLAGLMPDDFDDLRYAYISLTAIATDGFGRPIQCGASWYNTRYFGGYSDLGEREELQYYGYSLGFSDGAGADRLDDFTAYLTYNTATYGDGESIRMTLLYDGLPVPNEGRVLYTVLQNEMIDSGVFTADSLTLTQNVGWANSVNIVAAYFDGHTVHPIRNTVVRFDADSAVLNLDVTTNQSSYRPGDSMTVTVRATDAAGSGVAGNVVVSVVDESIFALKEQYVSVQDTLYGDMYFYNTDIKKYTTSDGDLARNHGVRDGGKGGDILGFYDSYRKDFRDTAAFIPLRTGANGVASTTFTLPDNTTSWRITTVAIGDNLYAGNARDNVISSLPFYIRPVVSTKYIEGDEIAMLVQAHGSLLNAEIEVDYTVTLTGDGFDETQRLSGMAYTAGDVNFGTLPVGEYTLVATARYSGYSDTVELPVQVIPSNLAVVVHRELALDAPVDINAVRYPVVIEFYDEANHPYMSSLSSLLSHYCNRADQRMSRYIAKEALINTLSGENMPLYLQGEDVQVADLQSSDGGVAWYTGGDSDPVLTARMAILVPDKFNRNSMRGYLRRTADDSRDAADRAAGFLGLAALGEPVHNEIELLLEGPTDIHERFYLIAAMSFCEDQEARARALYAEHITPLLQRPLRAEGLTINYRDPTLTYEHEQEANRRRLTAAAWISATRLRLDDADEIAVFLSTGWRISSLFECMYYVQSYDREIAPTTLRYSVNGVERTLDLGLSGHRSLRFDKSQLDTFELIEVPDTMRAMAYYIGTPDEADFNTDSDFSVTKTITEADNGLWKIQIRVDFDEDAPLGYYDISEWVPSNTRLYEVDRSAYRSSSEYWATHRTEGQNLYFQLHRYSRSTISATLTYYVRPTFDSEAVVDHVYVIHADSGTNAVTERSRWPS